MQPRFPIVTLPGLQALARALGVFLHPGEVPSWHRLPTGAWQLAGVEAMVEVHPNAYRAGGVVDAQGEPMRSPGPVNPFEATSGYEGASYVRVPPVPCIDQVHLPASALLMALEVLQ